MNSLVVFPGEGWESGHVTLESERARVIGSDPHYKAGAEVRLAYFGGAKGIGRVISQSRERLVIEVLHVQPSLALRPIDLIVGLSRPQTTKKVIQAAVMAGVRSLHLVHLDSGQRSYLDAHLLQSEQLRLEVAKSLEQIWEGLHPTIRVHESFRLFLKGAEDLLVPSSVSVKLVAHPVGSLVSDGLIDEVESAVIAVGSEGGWSTQELDKLESLGFSRVGLGRRVVRVEVALLYLLGQTLSLGENP